MKKARVTPEQKLVNLARIRNNAELLYSALNAKPDKGLNDLGKQSLARSKNQAKQLLSIASLNLENTRLKMVEKQARLDAEETRLKAENAELLGIAESGKQADPE